jgi:chromatin remodeling complex protein RSC6
VPVAAPVETTGCNGCVVDTPVAEPTFEQELAEVQRQLETVRASATAALSALKRVAKRHAAEVKDARKNRRAKKAATEGDASAPRKPNNFEIPVAISDELSAFFGGGKGAQMSRAAVNKAMSEYIKSHGLGQGQQINPDAALRKLLSVGAEDKVTIFNIQKYLARHYPKAAKA